MPGSRYTVEKQVRTLGIYNNKPATSTNSINNIIRMLQTNFTDLLVRLTSLKNQRVWSLETSQVPLRPALEYWVVRNKCKKIVTRKHDARK